MKITVLAVGKSRGTLASATTEFEARASRYWKLEVVELAGGTGSGGSPDEDGVRRAEGRRLQSRLPKGAEVWALTRGGDAISSEGLARTLGERALASAPGVTFVIGGAFGLDPALVKRADRKLSLSEMTLPHALARLVLAEQLYRAGTILRNEPYHKGGAG